MVTPETQSSDYESGMVLLESGLWRIRTGRITPTKPGAFVAVWRRLDDGSTVPFGADDPAVGLHVFVEEQDHFGVFQFAAEQLASLGISQTEQSPGKRGFRVYPSWSTGLNRQAARSQKAQSPAFRDLTEH
ncbi:MepB family protein [Glaciibacter superstes]|uniref:MepB family protein n=1 Tax=Glaciibacter superstes TaxID=501023 RepID=UPI0009FF993B|nr:MepB family protein [Glaciibacter superstes]